MHKFRGYGERSSELHEKLADLFSVAESLFNFWLDQERDRWTENIPIQCRNLALIQDAQALRLFRSVVEECHRCEGFSASILSRSLYETVLSVAFLLKKDVRIFVEPWVPKGSPPGTPPSKYIAKFRSSGKKRSRRHLLSREFRAELLLAYDFFQLEGAGIDSISKYRGFHHKAKKLRKSIDAKFQANIEKSIGPAWTWILQHSNTYAGLSVKDLAGVLNRELLRWYETVYHFQSRAVHAFDPHKHLEVTDDDELCGAYLSSNTDIYQSLRSAVGMFVVHIHLIQENIGFGAAVDMAMESLLRKLSRIPPIEA